MVVTEHRRRRVLVTGAGGQMARWVVPFLRERHIEVTGLSLDEPLHHECDRFVVGSADDEDAVRDALEGVDGVVHLGAIPHPRLAPPAEIFRRNTAGTFVVLDQAARAGVSRVVVASSINATGLTFNPHSILPASFPIDEDTPADIADAYSLSKAVGEQTASMAHRAWGTDVVSIRFPLVKDEHELRAAAQSTAEDPARTVREGWGYLDVRDAADLVYRALHRPLRGAHVICATAADTLLDEPTEDALARWAPSVPRRRRFPGRGALIDGSRARDLLGFRPVHSVHEASVGGIAPTLGVAV